MRSAATGEVSEKTTMWTLPQNQQIMKNPSGHLYAANATFPGSKTSLGQGQEYQLAMNFEFRVRSAASTVRASCASATSSRSS
jgi:hypothetical protein